MARSSLPSAAWTTTARGAAAIAATTISDETGSVAGTGAASVGVTSSGAAATIAVSAARIATCVEG
ncbi:hypothetical protein [Aurantimonas sp. VKM B-3413]|uniref:hypothetical protein n=1 Tax=Aurantimonas sp. VKM B-3413 TaxID=2779401 RepID=UPI001E5AFF3D|nr:hypothetical protein [Aurantimonas sp. VKM B-3413]MCB8836748.1 hypothetical protein [Aurantimonas sp. VKM B-3413]